LLTHRQTDKQTKTGITSLAEVITDRWRRWWRWSAEGRRTWQTRRPCRPPSTQQSFHEVKASHCTMTLSGCQRPYSLTISHPLFVSPARSDEVSCKCWRNAKIKLCCFQLHSRTRLFAKGGL